MSKDEATALMGTALGAQAGEEELASQLPSRPLCPLLLPLISRNKLP